MISVVVPLFNKASHIENTVRSVLAQSYQDFELIVVNDGSTDRGPEIVKAINDPRVIIIEQGNAGVAAARNRGIDAARRALVAFLDADDLWNRDFLATVIRLSVLHPHAGLHATAYQILTRENKLIDPRFKAIPSPSWEGVIPSYFQSAALGDPPVCSSACCVPRRILAEVGGFPEGRRMGEDLDLWGRIALRYPVAFSSYKGAVYCQNAENRACLTFGMQDEHPFIETINNLHRVNDMPVQHLEAVDLYITRLGIENIRQHVLAGNIRRARELSRELKNKWAFPLRQFLWGSSLNGMTRMFWYLRYSFLP
ncbi:MAG TPA: glycosyltransferase family A protein [Nitrospirota bacterium]|nr:glycosyltransferase family A protein [Nitrospirota bacterium]